ncbi:MAG: hypothetical protein OXC79_03500, partial [Candidatus Poribacteria bacterium]|nr:hypothetical protein [Candidatus Poribacteria bacterium]
KKGIKPRRGGMFISAVAKTPSKTAKLTLWCGFLTAPGLEKKIEKIRQSGNLFKTKCPCRFGKFNLTLPKFGGIL